VPTPREQSGALSEASRLLQEGLQLLDDRTREVDALVQDAREQAREITYDAEKRAQEITAEADRQRVELEEQVAVLRTEVAQVREELAQLRGNQGAKGAALPTPVVAVAPEETGAEPFGPTLRDPVAAADAAEAAEAAGTPRWGRPSSIASAQQATRSRSARPRWLPRWLPFLILLLAGAGVVTASVNGQSGGRGSSGDQPSPGVITVTLAPATADAAGGASALSIAAATSIATSLVAMGAAGTAGQSTQPTTPARPTTLATTRAAPTAATLATITPTATPRLGQTLASTRLPSASVQPAPLVTPSVALPYDFGP